MLTLLKESTICTSVWQEHEGNSLLSVCMWMGALISKLGPRRASMCHLVVQRDLWHWRTACWMEYAQRNIVIVRAKTKWKHAGDRRVWPQGHSQATVRFVDLTVMSTVLDVAQTPFTATSELLQCAGWHFWLPASWPHDWAYPLRTRSLLTGTCFCNGTQASSLHVAALKSQML